MKATFARVTVPIVPATLVRADADLKYNLILQLLKQWVAQVFEEQSFD